MPYTINWTQEMVDYLLSNKDKSAWEIGRALGMSEVAVYSKFRKLGIMREKKYSRAYEWTEERDAYLREHYPDDATCDVAEALGTCYGTVMKRVKALGLEKSEGYDKNAFHNRWCKDYKHSIRKVA